MVLSSPEWMEVLAHGEIQVVGLDDQTEWHLVSLGGPSPAESLGDCSSPWPLLGRGLISLSVHSGTRANDRNLFETAIND